MDSNFDSWCPTDVEYTITLGTNSFIGYVDDSTILKYPQFPAATPTDPDDETTRMNKKIREQQEHGLFVEQHILRVLGKHPRVVRMKGEHKDGILLEYVPSGSVLSYLHESPSAPHSLRSTMALQAAEAVDYIHSKNVLHCNIHPNNMLLDEKLNIKLCDFQGKLLNHDGTIQLDGWAGEDAKFSMPRLPSDTSSRRTDIFALGSAIYFIMQGHLPFPDLDAIEDEQKIEQRWISHQFPELDEWKGGNVVRKCWTGEYERANEIMRDLEKLSHC
jgi:serine/threonine protein kinase